MLDLMTKQMRFWNTVFESHLSKQNWGLDNEIVLERSQLVLRRFNSGSPGMPAVLIIPPNAGHHSNIAEPLVRTYANQMPGRDIFAVEWLQAKSYEYGISDMISEISHCVEAAGSAVHLVGLCQGAWAGAIYTSLYPDTVASYTNAAGPIDFAAGDGKIKLGCDILPLSFYRSLVLLGGGVQKGLSQVIGFKNLNFFDRYLGDYLELWEAVCEDDEGKIARWERFKGWYEHTVDLNGQWYLEAVEKLFKKNLLISGQLEVLGRLVNLSEIRCPVFLLAGEKDDITPVAQVFNMEQYVSGPVCKYEIKDAGHIGVFVKESSMHYWTEVIGAQKIPARLAS